jgi:hypothetical protein
MRGPAKPCYRRLDVLLPPGGCRLLSVATGDVQREQEGVVRGHRRCIEGRIGDGSRRRQHDPIEPGVRLPVVRHLRILEGQSPTFCKCSLVHFPSPFVVCLSVLRSAAKAASYVMACVTGGTRLRRIPPGACAPAYCRNVVNAVAGLVPPRLT